jgi:hypothetical protein
MSFLSRIFNRGRSASATAPDNAARDNAASGRSDSAATDAPKSERNESVAFDDTGVTRTLSDGRIETVTWEELQEVFIITTDEGPYVEDVYWMLSGNGRGCAIASGADGMKELVPRLQQLPGFDNAAVVQAMGSTLNARFPCWKRPGQQSQ